MPEAAVAGEMPDNFLYLEEIAPGILQDVRYHGSANFLGQPVDGYLAPRVLLTREAARALKAVQEDLEDFGLGLKIFDGYRPQRAVDHFLHWAADADDTRCRQEYYPRVEKAALIPEGYLSPSSAHSRGSTVDLTMVTGEGRELDMGTPFDFFDPASWPQDRSVPAQQRANRLLLRACMDRRGFDPHPLEWWHFTLRGEPWPSTCFDFPVE